VSAEPGAAIAVDVATNVATATIAASTLVAGVVTVDSVATAAAAVADIVYVCVQVRAKGP
jgi:uncharacterized RmlC-like cupin family protein